jgi:hypothetical protein
LIGTNRIVGRPTASAIASAIAFDVVALIGLHVRLYVLGWNQTYVVSLLLQRTAQEMGASAGFHAYQMDLSVRGEAQQLSSRKLLAHDNFSRFCAASTTASRQSWTFT